MVTGNTVDGSSNSALGTVTVNRCAPGEPDRLSCSGVECNGRPVCSSLVESYADAPALVTKTVPSAVAPDNSPAADNDQVNPVPLSGNTTLAGNATTGFALTTKDNSNPVAVAVAVRSVPGNTSG